MFSSSFTQYEFLHALEVSHSTTSETGWIPHHLSVWQDDEIVGVVPLFLKTHSYGEYVFDWAWADAYQRHGLKYYPKLLNAIPFTPVTGPRVLTTPQYSQVDFHKEIMTQLIKQAQHLNLSSALYRL